MALRTVVLQGGPEIWDGRVQVIHKGESGTLERGAWLTGIAIYEKTDAKRDVEIVREKRAGKEIESVVAEVWQFREFRVRNSTQVAEPLHPDQLELDL